MSDSTERTCFFLSPTKTNLKNLQLRQGRQDPQENYSTSCSVKFPTESVSFQGGTPHRGPTIPSGKFQPTKQNYRGLKGLHGKAREQTPIWSWSTNQEAEEKDFSQLCALWTIKKRGRGLPFFFSFSLLSLPCKIPYTLVRPVQ